MNICFVCDEYPPGSHGGIGTFTQMLARGLVESGHGVRVVGTIPPASEARPEETDHGVRIVRQATPRHRAGWIVARYRLFQIVARWSREGVVDLVELPDPEGWAAFWPSLPVPLVVRLHGSFSYFKREMGQPFSRRQFWLERASLRRADAWCSVSAYTAEKTKRLFKLTSNPSAILYNPVGMPDAEVSVPRSRHDVVFTGTLVEKKGVISLLKCWRSVCQRCPAAELHLYGRDGTAPGGGSMKAHLLSLLDAEHRRRVYFHDHVARNELQHALSAARVAVFPSYAEAFAIAPMEAMICGCPTIYSCRGSGKELIRDGHDGLLVDPDDIDQLAKLVVRLLADDELATQLGSAGRRRILDQFTLQQAVAKNECFYGGVIDDFQSSTLRQHRQRQRTHVFERKVVT